ncbi:MAG: TerB family tellurite resistance protein [Woeseiaceae bacterium]|nr:TerB family tellurite resistance protein [Woeseiaceae bacterium]
MIEELKPPRIEGDELIIETQSRTESYDSKYLLAALLLYVVRGDRKITEKQSQQMLGLIESQFGIASAESLELLRRAMTDLAENPDMDSLLRELSMMLSTEEKEDFAVTMLKAAAADGPKDADEMEKLQKAADIMGISPDTLHNAYDRYFAETDTDS